MRLEWGTIVENINATLLINLLNFALLLWLLKRLLFRPAMNWLDQRRQAEQERLERARTTEAEAESLRAQREEGLADANRRAREILAQANSDAQRIVREAREEARREARRIAEEGEEAARKATQEALTELRRAYAELVVHGAARVLEREVRAEDHGRLLENLAAELPDRLLS